MGIITDNPPRELRRLTSEVMSVVSSHMNDEEMTIVISALASVLGPAVAAEAFLAEDNAPSQRERIGEIARAVLSIVEIAALGHLEQMRAIGQEQKR